MPANFGLRKSGADISAISCLCEFDEHLLHGMTFLFSDGDFENIREFP